MRWRTRAGRRRCEEDAARTIQRILVRERDPISLMPIRKRFLLARHGVMIAYDAPVLLAYVRETGDLRDPVSRQWLRDHELMRLSRVCREDPMTSEQLSRKHDDEVTRRELLAYLQDEFLAEATRGTRFVEVLGNIHAIAQTGELEAIYRHFRRNGVPMTMPPSPTLLSDDESVELEWNRS